MVTVIEPAIRLFHHRWSVPIVATLYRERGCRFVVLLHHLAASRDTLSETLASLITAGVVMRNPGYGHPLRPEYILTPGGERLGPLCIATVAAVREAGLVGIALKKWPMLVLVAIARGAGRYHELMEALPGITARALALALKDLQSAALVDRSVDDGYPPTTLYQPTERAGMVLPALEALVRACESLPSAGASE